MEAADCLKNDDESTDKEGSDFRDISRLEGRNEDRTTTDSREKQEFCSESIAVLRAKAQEHNAKLTQTVSDRDHREAAQFNHPNQRDDVKCSHSDNLICRRVDDSIFRNSFEETHSEMEIRVV